MRKFRASLEPFWDLKISKYVEYLTCVSSKYITSWALLSLRSTIGWTSRIFLAYVRPWINKVSLALYIARIIVTRGWPARNCSSVTNLKFGRNTVLSSSSLWLKHRNFSQQGWESILDAISMISGASIDRCVRIILLTTFYHMHRYTMQLLGRWSRVHYYGHDTT